MQILRYGYFASKNKNNMTSIITLRAESFMRPKNQEISRKETFANWSFRTNFAYKTFAKRKISISNSFKIP